MGMSCHPRSFVLFVGVLFLVSQAIHGLEVKEEVQSSHHSFSKAFASAKVGVTLNTKLLARAKASATAKKWIKYKKDRLRDFSDIEMPPGFGLPKLQSCDCQTHFRNMQAANLLRPVETFAECQARKCGYCMNYIEYYSMYGGEFARMFPNPDESHVCHALDGYDSNNSDWRDCEDIHDELWGLPVTIDRHPSDWTHVLQAIQLYAPMQNLISGSSHKGSQAVCFWMQCCPVVEDDPAGVPIESYERKQMRQAGRGQWAGSEDSLWSEPHIQYEAYDERHGGLP